MREKLASHAATGALLSGALGAIGFVFLLLFYTLEAPAMLESGSLEGFAPLGRTNDALIGLSSLAAIPVAFRFHLEWRGRAATLSGAVLIIGVAAMIWTGITQLPYAVGLISSQVQGTLIQFGLGGLGLWLLVASWARADDAIRGGLRWLGMATGIGNLVLVATYFAAGGAAAVANPEQITNSPLLLALFGIGVLSSQIGYPAWALWLGRRLRRPD